jgi:23S rRNA (guanosine2251-2'-O)-methyltransferase
MDQNDNYIYGIHAVEELLTQRLSSVDHVYFDKDKRSVPLFNLLKICRKERLAYNLVPSIKLQFLCNTDKHQGIVAACSIKPYCTIEELNQRLSQKSAPLIVIAASVEDPSNLGALVRSCVAFDVDALLLERKNTAPLNASVSKSSAGMIEHLCIGRPKNLEGVVQEFVSACYSVIGAELTEGKKPELIDMTGPLIMVLGGEHRGIPPYLSRLCTQRATIPITEHAQSLNVSAAGAVLLYECRRQRQG